MPVRGTVRVLVFFLLASALVPSARAYEGSAFRAVRDAVFSDAYVQLPVFPVTREILGPSGENEDNRLRHAARRTLKVRDDLFDFPQQRKLLQPNGICFSGRWRIDRTSPFTGLLATGARALVVARASVALSETTRGHARSFALAVKLFPTQDPEAVVRTANLLVAETLSGTLHPHFLDAALDNEPSLGGLPALSSLPLALRIRTDLTTADRELSPAGPDLLYRPVDELASAGLDPATAPRAPRWVRLRIAAGTPRIDAADFRDELQLRHYPGGTMQWDILAAEADPGGKEHADWHRIGTLVLEESVVSGTCDTRLHFAHPILE